MSPGQWASRAIRNSRALAAAILLLGATSASAQIGQTGAMQSIPSDFYFRTFNLYFNGEYRDALDAFRRQGRGGIKNTQSFWIDSICYHAMAGEACYQLGQLDAAMQHYDSALALFQAYPDWMMRVQFNSQPRPAAAGQIGVCPWGQPKRNVKLAHFPGGDQIAQGRIDNSQALQSGGVVQSPVLLAIRTPELVRATALVIRRRHEILGPLGAHDNTTKGTLDALLKRPGPPNHWSECWIDLQLGLAYVAAGKPDQGRTLLERAVLCDGQWDHPLTATALLALGQLSLAQGDLAAAGGLFEEASYSAFQYGDPALVEEALAGGFLAHVLANRPGVYPPLAPATAWARAKNYRQLGCHLLIMSAESVLMSGDPRKAAGVLGEARSAMGRSDLPAARIGAALNHLTAALAYESGDVAAGDAALQAALGFQSKASAWLYRLKIVGAGNTKVTPRAAFELYQELLRDPTATDWRVDPLDSLAYLLAPRAGAFESWFELALQRNEPSSALAIADQARRHRFLMTQELGGRVLGLRWELDAPTEVLGTQESLERQDLLHRWPRLQEIAVKTADLQRQLRQSSLVPDTPAAARELSAALGQLDALSRDQERLLRAIAVRREPGSLVFPPRRDLKTIQAGLAPDCGALAFFTTPRGVYGFLITQKDFSHWQAGTPKVVFGQVAKLLQAWGHTDANRVMPLKQLTETPWRPAAQKLAKALVSGSKSEFPGPLTELVVVPDGPLWYLPFEALPLDTKDEGPLVIDKLRVRYAPLASLTVPDGRAPPLASSTAVVAGKLSPRDDGSLTAAALDRLTAQGRGVVALRSPLPAPSGLYAKLFDRVVVLDDISLDETGGYAWDPLQLGDRDPANSLARLLALPWGAPVDVLLPGFHSAAENSMRRGAEAQGDELFLNVTGLMACGARRILISRWRTGGQTALELVQEYLQESALGPADEAWQRAVAVARDTRIEAENEPRVDLGKSDTPPTAEHPFFWAGFLVIDALPPDEDGDAVAGR